MEKTVHPQQIALIELCKKIGLNQVDQYLLMNLMGWHDRGKGVPFSFLGVEPQASLRIDSQKFAGNDPDFLEPFIIESINQLLRHIIGEKLTTEAMADPISTLQDSMQLPRRSVIWLIAQMHLKVPSEQVSKEICRIMTTSPELMGEFVRTTLSLLLQRHA